MGWVVRPHGIVRRGPARRLAATAGHPRCRRSCPTFPRRSRCPREVDGTPPPATRRWRGRRSRSIGRRAASPPARCSCIVMAAHALCSAARTPIAWTATKVSNGENVDPRRLGGVQLIIGKPPNERATQCVADGRARLGQALRVLGRGLHLGKNSRSQPWSHELVILQSGIELRPRLRWNSAMSAITARDAGLRPQIPARQGSRSPFPLEAPGAGSWPLHATLRH